jgi:serine-type D-Ala-D-Ala carboxypeptidase
VARTFDAARDVLRRALADGVFPAASVAVGSHTEVLWREAFGRLTFDAAAPATTADTIFDLASLTKPMATAAFAMRQIERGVLALDEPVGRYISQWRGADRERVTIRDLLSHCGGLPAYLPFYLEHQGRDAFERAICTTPLAYEPRTAAVYSDLGFMLLGFVLEDIAPLPAQLDTLLQQMGGIQELQFLPPAIWTRRTAPTRRDEWRGRVVVGEVDDENAWALGGVAGHAGLFGTAGAVGEYARHVLQVLAGRVGAFRTDTLQTFITRRADVPGSSRALGWDTMLPTSSCGTRMSPRAFGHTGFTGTTLWIDPERGVYVVLLTNRVHPSADDDRIKAVRRALHDAVIEGL